MTSVLKKLGAIQSTLKAPKGQYNSFGKYKYRSCEDILEAVKPLLREQGCTLTVTDDVSCVGERYYITATATIYDNESGESVSNKASAREEENKKGMDGSQITGTASSYARKYALNGLFLIDDTKDADTDEFKAQQSAPDKTVLTCPNCGSVVKARRGKGGNMVQPADILKSCGGVCYDCYQAAKNGGDMFTAPADINTGV